MEIKGIMIELYTNNHGILNAAKSILFDKGDPRVNPSGYKNEKFRVEADDLYCLVAEIKFIVPQHRDDLLQSLKGLSGVIHQCEFGSKIIGYKFNEGATIPYEIETILRRE